MKSKGSENAGQVTPVTENRTVVLKRLKNEELRSREHLTPDRAYLHKIVPEANQKRFYAMTAIPTLFGEWGGGSPTKLKAISRLRTR